MDYEQAWNDMKRWLENGIEYMGVRKDELSGEDDPKSLKEFYRVKGKLGGLKTAMQYMEQSERIYKRDHEL